MERIINAVTAVLAANTEPMTITAIAKKSVLQEGEVASAIKQLTKQGMIECFPAFGRHPNRYALRGTDGGKKKDDSALADAFKEAVNGAISNHSLISSEKEAGLDYEALKKENRELRKQLDRLENKERVYLVETATGVCIFKNRLLATEKVEEQVKRTGEPISIHTVIETVLAKPEVVFENVNLGV